MGINCINLLISDCTLQLSSATAFLTVMTMASAIIPTPVAIAIRLWLIVATATIAPCLSAFGKFSRKNQQSSRQTGVSVLALGTVFSNSNYFPSVSKRLPQKMRQPLWNYTITTKFLNLFFLSKYLNVY